MRVRIIGGGVAGLGCALALRRRAGLDDVVVYEREFREQGPGGHGLLLMQNGVAALRALGVEKILDGYTPLERVVIQDGEGVPIRTESMRDVYFVTQAGLVAGLRAALPATAVVQGVCVDRVEVGERVSSVRFKEGPPLVDGEVDLFVGADGWRSSLCAALNPGFARPASRVQEIVTSSELPEVALQLGASFVKTVFPDRGLAFGLFAPTATRVVGFLQFDTRRYEAPGSRAGAGEIRAFLHELLDGAPEPVPSYLRRASCDSAHLWRPVDADLPPRISCANAVVIGDAAHPLLPFTSQGVSAALEDAVILADVLHGIGGDRALLAGAVAGFARDRARDVAPYIEGGRRILASFVEPARELVAPYVDGAVSRLEEHLSLPRGGMKNLLRVLDTDGDGRLDGGEVERFVDLLGLDLDGGEAGQLFRELDLDGDGVVTLEEAVLALGGQEGGSALVRRLRSELTPRRSDLLAHEARCRALFHLLDRDGDGFIDAEEFASTLLFVGDLFGRDASRRRFEDLDRDGNGRIDLAELTEGLRRPVERAGDPLFADEAVDLATLRRRAYNYRWAVQPEDVIPLTAADPDFPVAEEISDGIREYLRGGYLSYGPADGLPELRDAALQQLRARGMETGSDRIFATDSAASAVFLVARMVIEQPGDEAIIPDPVDFLLDRSVVAAGGVVKRFPLRRERGYSFDPAEIEALVTPRTKLLSICNPHNPLGRVWTRAELEAMTAIALRHDLRILSDEVWADIVYPPHVHCATAALGGEVARRTFTVLGFSKGYGLAGLRLGLLVSPTVEDQARVRALSRADDTAYGVSTLSQIAGVAALRSAGGWLARFLVHLAGQRDYAVARLAAMPNVRCHSPEGTYVVFPDVSAYGRDVGPLVADLRERDRVAIVPGSPAFFGPGAAGHVRLSFATSRRILAEGIDRLERGLRRRETAR